MSNTFKSVPKNVNLVLPPCRAPSCPPPPFPVTQFRALSDGNCFIVGEFVRRSVGRATASARPFERTASRQETVDIRRKFVFGQKEIAPRKTRILSLLPPPNLSRNQKRGMPMARSPRKETLKNGGHFSVLSSHDAKTIIHIVV